MDNNKKINSSLIYAIIGVLMLVLVIGGSTYAYYTASTKNDTAIKGTSAAAGLELKVNKLSTSAVNDLIPLTNTTDSLTTAAKGYGNTGTTFDATKSCIDKNGYSVCQVYEIVVNNKSTASVVLSGGVTTLEGDNTPNVACAVMASNISVINNASCKSSNSFANNVTFTGGETKTYYMIVYINNINEPQFDKGVFNGIVTFSSATGKLQAEFN